MVWTHPFTMLVAGPSASGKSTFVARVLENLDTLIPDTKFDRIVWCSGSDYRPSLQRPVITTFQHGVPTDIHEVATGRPCLVVLDDLMQDAYQDKSVSDLFSKMSHHNNVSVILITQNIFHQGRQARDISLNCKYFVLVKNPRDQKQFGVLARQMWPSRWRDVEEVYKDATREPHSYLVIDCAQDTNDCLRLQTDIFADDHVCTVYVPDVNRYLVYDAGTETYSVQ